jgi:hypothetical protein
MTDNESFKHFKLKCYEQLHLENRHYIPLGKNMPEHYNKLNFVLFKAWENGDIPEFGNEPILEEEVKQLDIFSQRQADILTDNQQEKGLGPLFDNIPSETKPDEQ